MTTKTDQSDKPAAADAKSDGTGAYAQDAKAPLPTVMAGRELDTAIAAKRPRGIIGRIKGEAVAKEDRPAALPMPAKRFVEAYTKPEVFERWSEDAAGIRAVETGDNVITMFGPIGEDSWTGEGVTAKRVTAQLRGIGPRPIEVQINSLGGDMFGGITDYYV